MRDLKTPESAKKYQAVKLRFFFIDLLFAFAFFLIFQLCGLSRITAQRAAGIGGHYALTIAVYLLIFGAVYSALSFPLKFYSEFILEKKYLLSNQTLSGWLKDVLKEAAISSVIFLVLTEIFYFLLIRSGAHWWIWMGLVWFGFSIFFARIFPTVILPLFYKYKDIENDGLKASLTELASRNKVKVLGIYEIDFSRKTNKANAALIGLGHSKRIIIADTLLKRYNDREIKSVIAHELGHYKYLHMWQMIIAGFAINLAGFYLVYLSANRIINSLNIAHIYDIEAFPAISLVLFAFGLLSMPLQNGFSRRLERQADTFALKETGDKEAFITCMTKLGEQNLADLSPNRFIEFLLYSHPSISNRIKFAKEYSA